MREVYFMGVTVIGRGGGLSRLEEGGLESGQEVEQRRLSRVTHMGYLGAGPVVREMR